VFKETENCNAERKKFWRKEKIKEIYKKKKEKKNKNFLSLVKLLAL